MADRNDEAREAIAEGMCHFAKSFNDKAKEGHATAADVGAALKLLAHLGGELRDDHPDMVATRDEIMDSIRDLDLDTLQ